MEFFYIVEWALGDIKELHIKREIEEWNVELVIEQDGKKKIIKLEVPPLFDKYRYIVGEVDKKEHLRRVALWGYDSETGRDVGVEIIRNLGYYRPHINKLNINISPKPDELLNIGKVKAIAQCSRGTLEMEVCITRYRMWHRKKPIVGSGLVYIAPRTRLPMPKEFSLPMKTEYRKYTHRYFDCEDLSWMFDKLFSILVRKRDVIGVRAIDVVRTIKDIVDDRDRLVAVVKNTLSAIKPYLHGIELD